MTKNHYEDRIRAEVAAVRADTWDEGYRAGYADGFDEADSTGATRGTNPYADRAPAVPVGVQACSSEPHPPHASQVPGFVGCPGTPRFAAIETHRCKNGHTLVFDAGRNMVHSNDGRRCNDVEFMSPSPFEVVASGYVDRSEPGQIVITEGLPRMGENRLGADSVMEWDDLSDLDAHLDDMGE